MGRKEVEKRRIERHQKATKVNKHNDRNFDLSLAEHIDQDRLNRNLYWNFYTNRIYTHEEKIKDNILSFSDVENAFYDTNFTDGLNAKNERYIKNRHKEHVQTMAQYQYHDKTCPLETIFQFGDKDHKIPMDLFQKIFFEQIAWEQETFPNVVIVDWAIHGDETVDHAHSRSVFIAHDKDGNLIVNKTKALEEMGLQRPDQSKKTSRYNNVMMTYTQMCRDHLLEVCLKYGLDDINYEPQEASKSGKTLQQYQYEEDKKQMKQLEKQLGEMQEERFVLADQNTNLQLENQNLVATKQELISKKQALESLTQELSILIETQKKQIEEQKQVITDGTTKLNQINEEAKEVFYLKESMQKDIEALQDISQRRDRIKKSRTKDYKTSILHNGYYLVPFEDINDYIAINAYAGQTSRREEAVAKREKAVEERERQIKHNQYIDRNNESLNRQLRERQRMLERDIKEAYEKGIEQGLVNASKALNMSVVKIKSAIDLFNQVELESEMEYE